MSIGAHLFLFDIENIKSSIRSSRKKKLNLNFQQRCRIECIAKDTEECDVLEFIETGPFILILYLLIYDCMSIFLTSS